MTIRDRSFTYRGEIKVSRSDFRLAKEGRKTCTIRLGTAQVEGELIDLTDGSEHVRVRVVSVDASRSYASITDSEALADGMPSREALDHDLRRFYGPIDPDQPMTLIHFALVEQADSVVQEQPSLW